MELATVEELQAVNARLRKSLAVAWSAFLGSISPEMWDDIKVLLYPDTWERFRNALLR